MQAQETTPLKPTRASFVRGLPETMPIAEVIERGREAGLEIKPADIHAARYYMRQTAAAQANKGKPKETNNKGTKLPAIHVVPGRPINAFGDSDDERAVFGSQPTAAESKTRAKRAARSAQSAGSGSPEEELRLLVMRIGTERARAVLEQIEGLKLRE
jgi:hypothetical protein